MNISINAPESSTVGFAPIKNELDAKVAPLFLGLWFINNIRPAKLGILENNYLAQGGLKMTAFFTDKIP